MENQVFSISRFGAYLNKYFSEYRGLRLQFAILTGVFAALQFIFGSKPDFFNASAALFLFAIISASSLNYFFTPRARKIKFLLTPASQFEKFLAMVVHLYIYIPIMFAVALFVAQYCATLVTALFTLSMPQFEAPFAGIDVDGSVVLLYILSYLPAVAFYLMGATIFTKNSFLKTTGLYIVVSFAFMLLMTIAVGAHAIGVNAFSEWENFDTVNRAGANFMIVMTVVVTLLFFGVSYMRISEMEVNETKK